MTSEEVRCVARKTSDKLKALGKIIQQECHGHSKYSVKRTQHSDLSLENFVATLWHN